MHLYGIITCKIQVMHATFSVNCACNIIIVPRLDGTPEEQSSCRVGICKKKKKNKKRKEKDLLGRTYS